MYDRMVMLRNNALHILSPSGVRFGDLYPNPSTIFGSVNKQQAFTQLGGS